jgi:DNA-binding GntR family transcriptional regulator
MRHGSDRVRVVAAPLRMQVIGLLRESILSFQYQPGQRLVERELCDRFGVSRTVIREALRHLEADGMVKLLPNRGPVVSTVSDDDARALFDIRAKVESMAARYFAERANARQKKRLQAAFKRVEQAYHHGHRIDHLRAKDAFYNVLCEGCGNAVIVSTLRTLLNSAQMLRGLSLRVPGRGEAALAELWDMVHAVEIGDVGGAERAAAEHVRKMGAAVLASLEAARLAPD